MRRKNERNEGCLFSLCYERRNTALFYEKGRDLLKKKILLVLMCRLLML